MNQRSKDMVAVFTGSLIGLMLVWIIISIEDGMQKRMRSEATTVIKIKGGDEIRLIKAGLEKVCIYKQLKDKPMVVDCKIYDIINHRINNE